MGFLAPSTPTPPAMPTPPPAAAPASMASPGIAMAAVSQRQKAAAAFAGQGAADPSLAVGPTTAKSNLLGAS